MAVYATHGTEVARTAMDQVVDKLTVTGEAIVLEYLAVLFVNLYGFVKVLRRKGLGVVPAILSFGDIFADKIVWQMAVDAGGGRVMAGLLPRVELRGHNMAIHAGGRIGAEIG